MSRLAVAAALVVLALAPLDASSPKFFQAATQGDFLKGEVENLSVDSHGRLTLGPATELVYETSAPFLWSLVAGSDGSIYVGSGNEGKVFRIDPQGKGSLFFDAAELEVHAMALAPDGGLYVATSPDGKIYKVDRSGGATTFFDPEDKYIWSLAVDSRGNVYAGTGEKGVVYKITPDGKGTPFYRPKTTHATALAFDKQGNLLVGTGSPGRVIRVDAEGKPFVLLDSPYQEVRSLHFDAKGMLYVAALSGRVSSGAAPVIPDVTLPAGGADTSARPPVPTVSAEITSMAIVDTSGGSTTTSGGNSRRPTRGAVYRIAPDGLWDELWHSNDDSPYDLAFDKNGALLIGTGNKGKIYKLEGDPLRPTLIARASAQQVTTFYTDPQGRLYFAAANPGKLFRLSTDRASRGTYESEARDAQMVSSWGTMIWHGTAPANSSIEIFTRSGNTETPDETWSAWSPALTAAAGSPIASPKARYLQWRAVLTAKADSPVLTSISAAYLQRNLRPQVRSITVYPPGIVFQKPYSSGEPDLAGFEDQSTPDRKLAQAAANASSSASPSLGRRAYQKGLQTITWKADDENDDDLNYEVQYRREGETVWKTLKKDLSESILVWDTSTVPNGTYFVKIIGSDASSNPVATALTGDLDSSAFDIDNTPPVISITSVRPESGRTVVVFDVTDDHSTIQRVEISTDGLQWRKVFPRDGIADSKSEHYELALEGTLGPRGAILRATDSMNNLSTAHVDAPRR